MTPTPPSASNDALEQRRRAACPRGVAVQTANFTEKADNAEIWDVEGRRLIDFGSGIAVLATGHRHPRVMRAVRHQLDRFHHTCFQVTPYEGYVELCERLNRLAPGASPKKTALFTTGVEAVENAVKIARAATGRSGVIAFSGAFHGRTLLGMALTGKVAPYKLGFGAMPADVWHVPFPVELHGGSTEASLRALDSLLRADVDPARVAAIFVELIQGEGGFYVAPAAFVSALRALCDRHGILLVVDEVQTGIGRTGRHFALEHHGVEADLIATAKSLAGGFPLSAVTGRADVMDAPAPGGLGGTYAGNPVAVAAALAVLDVVQDEGLLGRAERLGGRLVQRLRDLQEHSPQIADIRGIGSMVAVEFLDPRTREPMPHVAKEVQRLALERGLLLLLCGVHGNAIRFLYPLTIPETVFDEGLEILGSAIEDTTHAAHAAHASRAAA